MTEERKPGSESGPDVLKISRRNPVAAEAENNFAKITGRTSFGILKRVPIGLNKFTNKSNAPEERKICMAKNRAIKVGATSITILKPSLTPFKKGSYISFLVNTPYKMIEKIRNGKIKLAISEIIFFDPSI